MPKLITASCFMLFWVFYEMSGGAEFAPRERVVISQSPFATTQPAQAADARPVTAPLVTNAAFTPVETQALPAVATVTPEVIVTAAPQKTPTPVEIEEPSFPTVYVAGVRVNLRGGPGTNHPVLDTLPEGTMAELVATNDNGWAQIRLTDDGQVGWMAERLLSDS